MTITLPSVSFTAWQLVAVVCYAWAGLILGFLLAMMNAFQGSMGRAFGYPSPGFGFLAFLFVVFFWPIIVAVFTFFAIKDWWECRG